MARKFIIDGQEEAAVGKGATLFFPQDRYPYVITAVSKTGGKLTLVGLDTHPIPVEKGTMICSHIYTPEEMATMQTREVIHAYRRKDGNYYVGDGCPVGIGKAFYYRNYAY